MAKGVLDSRKEEPKSAIEAVVAHLVVPFCRSSATRELRQGIARAFVHMLRHIPRPDLERYSAFVLEQCLNALGVQVCKACERKRARGVKRTLFKPPVEESLFLTETHLAPRA